jgi:hypothetical protein
VFYNPHFLVLKNEGGYIRLDTQVKQHVDAEFFYLMTLSQLKGTCTFNGMQAATDGLNIL